MNIENKIYYWAHMLDESFNKHIMNEGKHWPADYIKTAINTINASKLGQAPWYSDDFIQIDVNTFVDAFKPLSHKNSNLGFFMAIIRWFIEYSGSDKEKYQEFIERKLDNIIAALLKITTDKSYDGKYDELKKMKFADFEKIAEKVNSQKTNIHTNISKAKYNIVPIYSYEELNKKYGGDKTGYKGDSEWCHTNGNSTYETWTKNGTQMFFVIEREDWEKIQPPDPKTLDTAYDEYGLSLIAILVDVKTGKLLNATLRWNHVVTPATGAVDKAFDDLNQLNKVVGFDVKKQISISFKDITKKQNQMSKNANEYVAKLLLNKTTITVDTIPKKYKSYITNVVIPDSVTSIGDYAFDGYNFLINVTIPDSVTRIGDGAFYTCNSLTSIVIPNSVKSIGTQAFVSCSELASVTIHDGVKSIGTWAFYGCSSLTNVIIPDSVTHIAPYVFEECSGLTSVTIGNSVTSIGNGAFHSCNNLTSMMIHDSVISIGNYAFWGCRKLKRIMIPGSVANLGNSAFYGCSELTNVVFKGKTLDEVKKMTDYPWGIKDTSIIKVSI